ncbi:MAG: hypothetical protein ABII79_00335 [bacterium]
MKARWFLLAAVLVVLPVVMAHGESDFFKQFKFDYAALDMDLLNNMGERAEIKDFVYRKDLATFTFHEGYIHLLRYVDGRPTTAIFTGKGNATISISSHLERQALAGVANDSIVDEDFEVAFIRMADDFDLLLKEKFAFEQKELKWKTFTIAKQAQGEQFFRPIILHTYDNYFQLLRSLYERTDDGYFWIDFNRYVFSFDPNRPEQVAIDYELGVSDLIAAPGASFQGQEIGINDDDRMSVIEYPTTIVSKSGQLEMGGIDGFALDHAEITIDVILNADSLKFVSLFLPAQLKEDSIHFNGQPVEYHRRKDFDFIGIILPQYHHRGDTLVFTFWYKGKKYDRCLPYVEDPAACPHEFTFTVPHNYNYYVSGMSAVEQLDGKRDRFTVTSSNPYNDFYFHVYTSDIDTIAVASDVGIVLNVLKLRNLSKRLLTCFVSDEMFQGSIKDAFNYLTTYLGSPPGTFVEYVVPERAASMPGLIMTSQMACATETPMEVVGGFDVLAGEAVARQWFGTLLRPASDREAWIADALPRYLGLMFLHNKQGVTYQTNLRSRRDSIFTDVERKRDMPLAAGRRTDAGIRANKGVWLMHMLRFLMYDLNTGSEQNFLRFVQEFALAGLSGEYTNHDFITLAEKHYGQPLDWFSKQWLYGRNFPHFQAEYKIDQTDKDYYIDVKVTIEGVDPDFTMPVVMGVTDGGGHNTYFRETISSPKTEFKLGPFTDRPQDFVFNEFHSVLSKDKVKKK